MKNNITDIFKDSIKNIKKHKKKIIIIFIIILLVCLIIYLVYYKINDTFVSISSTDSTTTYTYNYTGKVEKWTVPSNIYEATFNVVGGNGDNYFDQATGGLGAFLTIKLPVIPTQTYDIFVGTNTNCRIAGSDIFGKIIECENIPGISSIPGNVGKGGANRVNISSFYKEFGFKDEDPYYYIYNHQGGSVSAVFLNNNPLIVAGGGGGGGGDGFIKNNYAGENSNIIISLSNTSNNMITSGQTSTFSDLAYWYSYSKWFAGGGGGAPGGFRPDGGGAGASLIPNSYLEFTQGLASKTGKPYISITTTLSQPSITNTQTIPSANNPILNAKITTLYSKIYLDYVTKIIPDKLITDKIRIVMPAVNSLVLFGVFIYGGKDGKILNTDINSTKSINIPYNSDSYFTSDNAMNVVIQNLVRTSDNAKNNKPFKINTIAGYYHRYAPGSGPILTEKRNIFTGYNEIGYDNTLTPTSYWNYVFESYDDIDKNVTNYETRTMGGGGDWWEYTFNTPQDITLIELFGGVNKPDWFSNIIIELYNYTVSSDKPIFTSSPIGIVPDKSDCRKLIDITKFTKINFNEILKDVIGKSNRVRLTPNNKTYINLYGVFIYSTTGNIINTKIEGATSSSIGVISGKYYHAKNAMKIVTQNINRTTDDAILNKPLNDDKNKELPKYWNNWNDNSDYCTQTNNYLKYNYNNKNGWIDSTGDWWEYNFDTPQDIAILEIYGGADDNAFKSLDNLRVELFDDKISTTVPIYTKLLGNVTSKDDSLKIVIIPKAIPNT